MNRVADLLSFMSEKGVRLWVDNGQLHYRAAEGVLRSEQIATLRESKAEIIAMLKQPPVLANPKAALIRAAYRLAPLTFQQEWFWNWWVKKHSASNCLVTSILRLRGALDVGSLGRSVREVVRRHESLRTQIVVVDGVPKQQINQLCEDNGLLKVATLSGASKDDVDREAQRLVGRLFAEGLGLTDGPLFEARLLKLAEHEHVLIIAIHHIVTDGLSLIRFFEELWVLYTDFMEKRQPSIATPMQYADYAVWQRNTASSWQDRHGDYWSRRLARAARVRFPIDSGLEAVERCTAAEIQISFSEKLSSALCEVARHERTTPSMVILALYAAIVLRWCKQIDFVIPFNVSGRSCPEQLEAMGLFVHPLLLRMELNGSETLQELLGLVSQEFLAAHEHLDCGRAIAEAPDLLNGSFLNWVPWEPAELAGIPSAFGGHHSNSCLAVESFDISGELTAITRITKKIDCDIGMTISNTNQGIRWSINYRADLFTVDTMHRLARDLQLMAEQMVGDPRVCAASFHAGVETRNC